MRRQLLLGAALAAAAQLSATGLLLTSAWLIVRAAEQPPVLYLMVAIVGVRFFGVGRAAARYAERLVTHDVALRAAIDLRIAVYAAVARLAPHGLGQQRHGDIVRQAVEDVETSQDRLLRIRLPWWSALAVTVVVTAVVGVIAPAAGAIVGAQAALTLMTLRLVVPRLAGESVSSPLAADVTESMRAAPELIVLGAHGAAVGRADGHIERTAATDRRRGAAGGSGSAIVLIAAAAALAAIATVPVPPVLGAVALLAPLALAEALDPVAEAERLRPRVTAAELRLADLLAAEPPVASPVGTRSLPQENSIQLDDVTVGWDRPLVRGLTARIGAGEVIGVSGPSGSGKSTLALTLNAMVAPLAGVVRLGGVDLRDLAGSDVLATVGYLGQDDAVFDTTARENLRIARPDASDDELLDAMARVGLSLDLDRAAGEQGSHLSGGERQRLALARLLLGRHPVLVLDEPTEHLDAPLARALMDDVLGLAPTHTLVLISHDPTVLARCDRVLDLVTGRIVVPRPSGDAASVQLRERDAAPPLPTQEPRIGPLGLGTA